MKKSFNIYEPLNELIEEKLSKTKISSDEFWNYAGQTMLNMIKNGELPDVATIKDYERLNK